MDGPANWGTVTVLSGTLLPWLNTALIEGFWTSAFSCGDALLAQALAVEEGD